MRVTKQGCSDSITQDRQTGWDAVGSGNDGRRSAAISNQQSAR